MFAQSFQESFGQNRVQFHSFDWSYYETEHFNIYFYKGGQDIGKYMIYSAEKNLKEIGENLGVKFRTKINLLIFFDISDANQTNIGGGSLLSEPNTSSIRFVDNKLFLYFDGNHGHLEKQFREGITQVYLEKLIIGGNIVQAMQNFITADIPLWFTEGLQAYNGEIWNTEMDNILKDKFASGQYSSIKKINAENQRIIGHSMWHFLDEKYGKEVVKNIVYYTRRTKNVENALYYSTGKSTLSLFEEWYNHFREKYKNEIGYAHNDSIVNFKYKKKKLYYQFKTSPNQQYIAYVQNNKGRYKVFLKDRYTNKTKVLLRGGFKTQSLLIDQNYPLLDFSRNGELLAIIDERRDQVYLNTYNFKEEKLEEKMLEKFQRIYSFSFMQDKKMIVLSGSQKGVSDIYTMNINTQTTNKITADYYDDAHPRYWNNGAQEGIIFSSNRPIDSVAPKNTYQGETNNAFSDLFYYDLNKDENQLLGRLTNTPLSNETYPEILDSTHYSYLSDVNGVNNLYRGSMSNEYQYTLYNYTFKDSNNDLIPYTAKEPLDYENIAPFNIYKLIEKSTNPVSQWIGHNTPISSEYSGIIEVDKAKKSYLFAQIKKGKPTLRLKSLDSLDFKIQELPNTSYRNSIEKKNNLIKKDTIASTGGKGDTIVIAPPKKQFFQTEFDYLSDTNLFKDNIAAKESYQRVKFFMIKKNEVDIDSSVNYRFSKTRPYFTRFYVSQVNININNSLLIDRYQKYPNPRTIPQYSPMIQFGIKDLFENYHIYGGFRVAFDLNANEVFIALENVKKRWDKRYTFLRRALTQEYRTEDRIDSTVKYVSNYIDFLFSYPIDYTQRISINTGFKTDKNTLKVTNIQELNSKPIIENWIYVRPEYVFDNSIMRQMNIPNGTKFKAFVEFYKEIPTKPLEITKGFDLPIPQWNEGYFLNWGFDFRHYQPVSKNIIWATRMMYSSSVGTRKMLYQIGGTEGEIFPSYDNSSIINPMANYAFQSYINNLRGFMQNTRNGNNVAIMNTELRIPIISYLIKKPLKNAFLRNFQVTTFVDIGMAWNGINPYARDNPFYIKPYTNGITTINANYLKNPMVGSTGFGFRSSLLGYFLKVDFGLGFDSGKFNKKLYTNWSVSMDF